jgi:hypothetical protein
MCESKPRKVKGKILRGGGGEIRFKNIFQNFILLILEKKRKKKAIAHY